MKKKYFFLAILTNFLVFMFCFPSIATNALPLPDPDSLVAYFQAAVDWGIEVSARYLAFLAASVLAVSLFKN
ncbi:hypothetical protein [Okeania sp. SIO2B3]|uniref:hypothetical protein n=1 Tax=Okeania sp. SIO2B3 TaxID=2607784 RepID=UPI0013C0C97E|nr:hypothetical protein [Okeania sp. SIO2B3]NET46706.1 hypothetical protein [Okeania sp. SIO2B3]